MNYEFEVVFQRQLSRERSEVVGRGSEPFDKFTMTAESDDQVRAVVEKAGGAVLNIVRLRPVIDWTKPNFNRDEAAAFLCIKGQTLSENKGGSTIPFAAVGRGIYPREWLEAYVNKNANSAAREFIDGHGKAA